MSPGSIGPAAEVRSLVPAPTCRNTVAHGAGDRRSGCGLTRVRRLRLGTARKLGTGQRVLDSNRSGTARGVWLWDYGPRAGCGVVGLGPRAAVGTRSPLIVRPSGLRPAAVAWDSGPGRGDKRVGSVPPQEARCTGTRRLTIATGLRPVAGGVMRWHQAPTVAAGLRPAARGEGTSAPHRLGLRVRTPARSR